MSKADRERRLQRGDELLGEWGVGADAVAFGNVVGRDADADLAIAARLGAIAGPASVEMLRNLESKAADKVVRKEAKRSLYRLEQQGVEVERPALEPRKLTLPAAEVDGYMSPIDGRGDQLIWLTKGRAGGLLHLFAVVNDPEGLKDLNLAEISRKGLRSLRETLIEKHEIRLIEVDWRYCDFLIDRAFQWSSARGHTGGDYPGVRTQLTTDPVTPMEPLILRHLDRDTVRADDKLVEQSASLLDEAEFRTWFFDREALAPYLEQLSEVRDSPIVLNDAQKGERLNAITERAVREIFGGDLRDSWCRRLEEMAYYFHATRRVEQAKMALAAGLALAASDSGGKDVPLFDQLCRTSLLVYWQIEEKRQQEQARSSLIVSPQQAAMEAEARRRTRG